MPITNMPQHVRSFNCLQHYVNIFYILKTYHHFYNTAKKVIKLRLLLKIKSLLIKTVISYGKKSYLLLFYDLNDHMFCYLI